MPDHCNHPLYWRGRNAVLNVIIDFVLTTNYNLAVGEYRKPSITTATQPFHDGY